MTSIRLLKAWSVLVLLVMLALCIRASLVENVFVAGIRLGKDPWGLATLADCGFAFAAVGMWIGHRERSVAKGVAWTVAIMALGNLAIAGYVLLATLRLRTGEGVKELVGGRA